MLGATTCVLIAVIFAINSLKDSLDPNHAQKIANEMVIMSDPLPGRWKYGVGVDVGYEKSANFQNGVFGKGHALVQIMQLKIKGHSTAEQSARKFAMPNVSGMSFDLESRGEEKIAGQTAYYVREHGVTMGRKSAVEVAFIDLPNGDILQIHCTQDSAEAYDPTIFEPLLKSIKGIRQSASSGSHDAGQGAASNSHDAGQAAAPNNHVSVQGAAQSSK